MSVGSVTRGRASASQNVYWLLVIPLLALVTVLYAYPIAKVLWISFSDPVLGLQNYEKLITSGTIQRILWRTLRICVIVTLLSVIIGYLVAYAMMHVQDQHRTWMLTLVLVSFWVSVLVRAFAWLTLLRSNGIINEWLIGLGLIDEPLDLVRNQFGVLVGMVHYMIPYAVLPLLANMKGIDTRLMSASRGLGAGAFETFIRIYLPLSLPGIIAAGLLVFIISLGFFVTPAILGGGRVLMIAEYVSVQVLITTQWGTASMLSAVLLITVFGLLFLMSRFVNLNTMFGAR